MSVLTINQPVNGFDLEGSWSEFVADPEVDAIFQVDSLKMGGEDFLPVKVDPSRRVKKQARKIEFNKDGTGKYVETVSRKKQEFTFRYVIGEHTPKEHYVFIAFDKPFLAQEKPLLVFVAEVHKKDRIVLTAVKKNSPLGDRIKRIAFDRQEASVSK